MDISDLSQVFKSLSTFTTGSKSCQTSPTRQQKPRAALSGSLAPQCWSLALTTDIYNTEDSELVERGLSGAEANGNMGLPKENICQQLYQQNPLQSAERR